ncbi:MAG TPA: metallophosphoesterase [Bryobacteraceae bacterium]|jgi:predicted phosphodiesterase|nr:metallophosphoesterase [Bryobacteraceae bacterium]
MKSLIALLLACSALLAAADKLAGGPFTVNVSSRSATVVWIVQSNELILQPPGGVEGRYSPAFRVEKTTLASLQPGTRYEYEVPGYPGVKGWFRTAAAPDAPSYEFLVYGDTRTRHDVHRKVVEAILKDGVPEFAIQSGDLVENGADDSLWPIYFDIEKDLLRQIAFFPVLGNHERNSRNFYEFFQATTPYYSFNWGNAHIMVLNSDIANSGANRFARETFWAEQTKWLESELEASQQAEYRIVVAHHPPFSAVSSRQGANPEMRALVPMFEKYHVSIAFFGHDHNYQRNLQNGINYVISGGGGAPLYDVAKPDPATSQKAISVENFVKVKVEGKVMKVVAKGIDGKILDEFEIRH